MVTTWLPVFKSLTYNNKQTLDLHLVDQPGRPIIVCLHGGGFHSGSRDDERCSQSADLLTEAGFNCASVSYSLAPRKDRFSMWPRNLFDVADAVSFLHKKAPRYGYDLGAFGMLGFSAGCCLSNLYIQGGKQIFKHYGYRTRVFEVGALVGFYGPYDFPNRQMERRSDKDEINRYHSPSYWLRQNSGFKPPPVLHIQGDLDDVVLPDQHAAFQSDCEERNYQFQAVIAEGFGHSFAPRDSNAADQRIDMGPVISEFFSSHLEPHLKTDGIG